MRLVSDLCSRAYRSCATSLRLAVIAGTLVASTAAVAQSIPSTISPLQIEPDRNGVNLTTGKISPPSMTLSVPGSTRLKFDRIQNAAPYSSGKYQKNIDSGDDFTSQQAVHTADGFSEGFSCTKVAGVPGGECNSKTASGSSMAYNGTEYRRAGTGERYVLSVLYSIAPAGASGNPDQNGYSVYYASRIEYADGEVISYTYESVPYNAGLYPIYLQRPKKISSNLGFFITIAYASTDVTQGAWYTPSEAAIFSDAAPTTPIQKFTYPNDSTTVDIGGRVYNGFGPGTLGADIEVTNFSRTLPGESTPAASATQSAGVPLLGQFVQDGVAYNYAYQNPQLRGTLYEYDRVIVTGPNGYSSNYGIQVAGTVQGPGLQNMVASRTDELNRTTTFAHDNFFRLLKVTYPELNSVAVTYDAAGNVASKTTAPKPGSGLSNFSEQTFVDLAPYTVSDGYVNCRDTVLCYRPQWYKDPLNRQTDFVYNSRGQITEQNDPADQSGVRRKSINDYQEVDTGKTHMSGTTVVPEFISRKTATHTCGIGTTCGVRDETRTEFDYWGNTFLPAAVRQIDSATSEVRQTNYAYDSVGRLLSVDGPLAGTADASYFRYDIQGRKTWEIGAAAPNGLRIAKKYTYRDADDKVTAVDIGTIPDPTSTVLTIQQHSDLTYDSRRYQVREAVSSGGTVYKATDTSFLDRGLSDCTVVRMNLAALPAASASGACAAGTAGSSGADRITRKLYDAAGQNVQVRQALGSSLERANVTYGYTANGKQADVIDANGNHAKMAFDGFDRLTKWSFPSTTRPTSFSGSTPSTALSTAGSVSTTDYEAYTYDAAGNRLTFRKRDGRILKYTYDPLNRAISKCVTATSNCVAPNATTGRDVYFAYDLQGLQLGAKFDSASGADGVTNVFNAFGERTASTISMGGFSKTLTSHYDADGNRDKLTHPEGNIFFSMNYDALDRMASATWTTPSGTTPFLGISYDNAGNRSGITRGSASTSYGYDGISRLTAMGQVFAGGTGNVNATLGYNSASQIASETRDSDAYAFNGLYAVNRTYVVNGLNQYTTAGPASFLYDANGNLTSDGTSSFVYDAENRLVTATTAGVTATIAYDPLGRLWQVVKGSTNTRFLYDGDKLSLEYNSSGGVNRRFMFGPGVDEPVLEDTGGSLDCSGTRFLHSDHQGSIVAGADCWGTRQSINTYDEYGVPSTTNTGRFGYTGQAWISELGMFYYKARMYSPTLGRFLQTDPIGYNDQINLYAYVGDDPNNGKDPSGLDTIIDLVARPLRGLAGQLGYEHEYVYLQDTESKRESITRAGPTSGYGSAAATVGAADTDDSGQTVLLRTQIAKVENSIETNKETGRPVGTKIPESRTVIKTPFDKVILMLKKFNNDVDKARITYRSRSTNSNAYAGTVFTNLTGKKAPASSSLPGSGLNLNDAVKTCRGSRIGNSGTDSIC